MTYYQKQLHGIRFRHITLLQNKSLRLKSLYRNLATALKLITVHTNITKFNSEVGVMIREEKVTTEKQIRKTDGPSATLRAVLALFRIQD